MSIKRLRVLWIKVHIREGKRFYLNIPLAFYAFEELLDCIMDLLNVADFLIPKKQNNLPLSVHTIKSLIKELIHLMDSLVDSEPYDFVNVEVENVKVSLKIR